MNAPDPLQVLKLAQEQARNDSRPATQQACENCTRVGLAILPVRQALLPGIKGFSLPAGLQVDGPAVDTNVASYGLRVLRKGYLYVYVDGTDAHGAPERRWDCYGVSPEGRLRGPYPSGEVTNDKTAAWTCGRSEGGSHAMKASFITIPRADKAKAAYFIFSQDPLSDETRADLAANPARMQKVDIQAWLAGGLPPSTGALGVDKVASHVLEYTAAVSGTAGAPFQTPARDRRAEAAATPVAMTRAMQGKYADRAMVMALHDRIGIVQEAIHARAVFEARMAELAAEHARKLFVASAVENLKADFTQRGKAGKWETTYAKAYKPAEVEAFKTDYMALYKPLESQRNAYGKFWCAWMADAQRAKLINSLNNRYHPRSSMDCVNQTRTIADMLNGTGGLSEEAQLWQRWLSAGSVDKDNLLDRAVTGGSASLLAFLTTRKDAAGPNVVDTFKTFYTAVDEWEKSNQSHVDYIRKASQGLVPKGIDPREWAVRRGEDLFEGLHKFYQTMAGNVSQMKAGAAKQVRHAVLAGILYFNVRFRPVTQTMTAADLAMDLKEVRWGTEAANKLQVIESTPTRRIFRINTTDFVDIVAVDSRRFTVTQFHVGDWRNERGLWLPAGNRSQGGIILPEGFVPATPQARPNGFMIARQWTTAKLKGGGTALGFSAVVLFFQYKAIEDSLQALNDPKATAQQKRDANLALVGAAIGAAGALAEGAAAAWQLALRGAATKLIGATACLGGFLGAASSAIAAWQMGAQAGRSWGAHDRDTALFLGAAAVAFAVGSVAAGAGAVAAFVGTAVWFGPVGWAAIAIGAIVSGIAAMFGASLTRDDPLEAWLKQCLFGIASDKFTDKDEAAAFNKLFELPLDAKLTYDTQILGAKHIIQATVTIPRLQGRAQRYEVSMSFNTIDGKGGLISSVKGTVSSVETVQQVLAPDQTPEEFRAMERTQAELSRGRLLFADDWRIDAADTSYELKRRVQFNNQVLNGVSKPYVTGASLEVKYWPDQAANPDLVIPPGGGPGGTPVQIAVPR